MQNHLTKNHSLRGAILTLVFLLLMLSHAEASQPTLLKSISDRYLPTNASSYLSIDLTQYLRADEATNMVRVTTSLTGSNDIPLGFTLQLLPSDAPLTVANFLAYVNDGAYENIMVHRLASNFVMQTGGFTLSGADPLPVATFAPITNEFKSSNSNTRGTVAMAKLNGDPNSATSQWFVNLADNSSNLDHQNGGFTVFARVLAEGMTNVVDKINSIPAVNLTSYFSNQASTYPNLSNYYTAFDSVPVTNNALVGISRVATIPYFALSSDSTAYAPRISNSTLFIDYKGGTNPPTSPVTISLFATDTNGLNTNTSFLVWHLTNQTRSISYPTNSNQNYSPNGFDMAFYPYSSDGTPLPAASISWTGPASFQGYTNGYNHFAITGTGTITFTYILPSNFFYKGTTNTSSFVISKASQAISFSGFTNPVVYSTNPYTITNLPVSSSKLPVTLSIESNSPARWKVTNSQLLFTGAGTVTLVANQSGNSNYLAASPVTSTLMVSKAPQTITFPNVANQVLTSKNPSPLVPLKAVSTSGLPVQYRVISDNNKGIITNSSLQVTGIGTVALEASLPETSNYFAAAPVTNTVTSKYTQTLRVFDKIPTKTFTFPYTSFSLRVPTTDSALPSSTNVVVTATPTNVATITGSSLVTITGAGTATLTATQAGDDFYFPASISTSFVVAKAPQTITPFAPIPAKTNGIASFPITVPVASSALPVTISASGAGYASTNGTNVTITLSNSGRVTVTATQSGSANYLAAKAVSSTFLVAKGNQSINFPAIDTNHVFGDTFSLQATAVPSGLPVSYRIIAGTNAARLINGTSINVTAPTGTVTIVASQAGNSGYNTAASKTNSFTITPPQTNSGSQSTGGTLNMGGGNPPFTPPPVVTNGPTS